MGVQNQEEGSNNGKTEVAESNLGLLVADFV